MLDISRFALNRIMYPSLDLEGFFTFATELGVNNVELRNDLPDGKILDNASPHDVTSLVERHGIQIITINAIQHFNLGVLLDQVYANVNDMLHIATAIGCGAIVLCPHNDVEDARMPEQFYADTVAALKKLAPLFEESGITGLVEPLGFEESSLRSKETAIRAIQDSGYTGYRLVHDTFHHYLGPDDAVYADYTGLVHISGVETNIPASQIRDGHRMLIGKQDIMANKAQIQALESHGYTGLYSFEPFSPDVHNMSLEQLHQAVSKSLEFIGI